MEMYYDGALVMPKNYAVVDEEEMTYVEGGVKVESHWWGTDYILSHKERVALTDGLAIAGLASLECLYLTGIIAAYGIIIWNHDEGNGVIIRQIVGVAAPLVFTR